MVVIVDGLDSGEQNKVLQVLDAVHTLFSDNRAPFIILLAIDPHIISKVTGYLVEARNFCSFNFYCLSRL